VLDATEEAEENPDSSIRDKEGGMGEDLKAVFQKYGTIKFINFKIGADSGYTQFEEPEAAQKAHAVALADEDGLIVKNFVATLESVTGEAEMEYWRQRESMGNREGL